MYVIGINMGHDGSACLMKDGHVIVAIEAERLCRKKHARITSFYQVVNYCLAFSELSINDIDAIIVSSAYPELLNQLREDSRVIVISHHLAHAYSALAMCGFRNAAVMICDGSGSKFRDVEEAYKGPITVPEEFEEAESYYEFKDGVLRVIKKAWGCWQTSNGNDKTELTKFSSFGHMYTAAAEYIFRRWWDAGKVMGLAPLGMQPEKTYSPIVKFNSKGDYSISLDWLDNYPAEWRRGCGWGRKEAEDIYKEIAYVVQSELEAAMLQVAQWLYVNTSTEALCIAGGVALNCVANYRILRETPFKELFIQPAAGDAGTAIGCAYYGMMHHNESVFPIRPFENIYLGRNYSENEIEELLTTYTRKELRLSWFLDSLDALELYVVSWDDSGNSTRLKMVFDERDKRYWGMVPFEIGRPTHWHIESLDSKMATLQISGQRSIIPKRISFRKLQDPEQEVAAMLASGMIIGWFQDRSEFGPRALGHRSILADPRDPLMLDRVNKVKGREAFRPLAPIVAEEQASRYFDIGVPSPYMVLATQVRHEYRKVIPAVTHIDNTARVQTVSEYTDIKLYNLLCEFEKLTGVPILLNTSFNDYSEPIVETPLDALRTFLNSEIDRLVLFNWLVTKDDL